MVHRRTAVRWARCPTSRYAPGTAGIPCGVRQFLRRFAARLRRNTTDSPAELGVPCTVCGKPATGWAVQSGDRNGTQIIEGYAACAAHQARATSLPRSKAG